jgi:hypothetical protein
VLALHSPPPADDSPYVFVFNGGEEALMTGAHAFAEGHRWAKECRYILNMDSCGAGGRGIVFQAGPGHPWLMDLYARVAPHPYGSVMAQDIFLSEVIPSDTDYRVYRDELGVRGFDIAYFENGYVYHTQIDDMRFIGTGSLQHEGDNVVALAKALSAQTEIDHPAFPGGDPHAASDRAVFFDIVGLVMVSYSATAAAWGHAALGAVIIAAWTARLAASGGRASAPVPRFCDEIFWLDEFFFSVFFFFFFFFFFYPLNYGTDMRAHSGSSAITCTVRAHKTHLHFCFIKK